MNNWHEKKFGEVAKIANGQVNPKKEPYCNYVYIGPENVESNTGRILDPKIVKNLALISGKYVFDSDAIIYSKIRPNLNKLCNPNFDGLCSADMYPIWPQDGISKEYLYYYMQSPFFVNEAVKCSTRTGIPKINRQDLARIKIAFPDDMSLQAKIVSVLRHWDISIEKTENLVNAKQKQFEWLKTSLINMGRQKRVQVSDLIFELSTRNQENRINRVLSVTNSNGFILPEDQFERRVASANLSNYKVIKRFQYAYNPSRINVGSIARLDNWEEGVLSPMYIVFKLDEARINTDYFLHWLSSGEAKQRIKKSAQGSVRKTVGFRDFGRIFMALPSLEEQKDIAQTLNAAQWEIKLLKQLVEKYQTQKQGLMQKLLTGEKCV